MILCLLLAPPDDLGARGGGLYIITSANTPASRCLSKDCLAFTFVADGLLPALLTVLATVSVVADRVSGDGSRLGVDRMANILEIKSVR